MYMQNYLNFILDLSRTMHRNTVRSW